MCTTKSSKQRKRKNTLNQTYNNKKSETIKSNGFFLCLDIIEDVLASHQTKTSSLHTFNLFRNISNVISEKENKIQNDKTYEKNVI